MIYLIEGPDGSGKTSLAQSIALKAIDNKEEFLYVHEKQRTGETNIPNIDYMAKIKDLLEWRHSGKTVVLDRSWISTIVYRSIYEPDSPTLDIPELLDTLESLVDRIILCIPGSSKEEYQAHFKEMVKLRKEDYPDLEMAGKVWEGFHSFISRNVKYEIYDILGKDKKE